MNLLISSIFEGRNESPETSQFSIGTFLKFVVELTVCLHSLCIRKTIFGTRTVLRISSKSLQGYVIDYVILMEANLD